MIGGSAVPVLEAWMLALLGERGTESLGKAAAQSKLERKGIGRKDTGAMVKVAANTTDDRVPEDATSLQKWLKIAKEVMPRVADRLQESAASES